MKSLSTADKFPEPDFQKEFLAGLAIDTVIFGFHESKLKILALKYSNTNIYALPGGFIRRDENVNDAAKRILQERTGLKNIYLEQFYAFGDLSRFDNAPMEKILEANGQKHRKDHWLLQRFVSISYYALVDYSRVVPVPDILSETCEWYDLKKMPKLMMDHNKIVVKALETLRTNLDKKLIAFNLMPDTFTMNELQALYETVLGEKLRRTSFHRKMHHLGILEQVAKKVSGGAHKAPYLYRLKRKRNKM